jgi:hypothetical protein
LERRKKAEIVKKLFGSNRTEEEVDEAIDPLDGIIAHLTRECCGSLAEDRFVMVEGVQFIATMRNLQ